MTPSLCRTWAWTWRPRTRTSWTWTPRPRPAPLWPVRGRCPVSLGLPPAGIECPGRTWCLSGSGPGRAQSCPSLGTPARSGQLGFSARCRTTSRIRCLPCAGPRSHVRVRCPHASGLFPAIMPPLRRRRPGPPTGVITRGGPECEAASQAAPDPDLNIGVVGAPRLVLDFWRRCWTAGPAHAPRPSLRPRRGLHGRHAHRSAA